MGKDETSRKTAIQVFMQGVDVSADLRDYILSLEYTDNETKKSDDLQIRLQDRSEIWLKSWLGEAINASSQQEDYSISTSKSSHKTCRFGNSGDEVKLMQELLLSAGESLPRYGVDGYFGSETLSAVKSFQGKNGLTVDGSCGPLTWAALTNTSSNVAKANKSDLKFSISASIVAQNWIDGKDSILDCGLFQLDDIAVTGLPNIVTLKASSLPFAAQIRQTIKSKAWENYSLSKIAAEMAKSNGMTVMFLSSKDKLYKRAEQYKQSDIAFLSKLCEEAGVSLKVTSNALVLFDQLTYDKKGSIYTIKKTEANNKTQYISYTLSSSKSETQYADCVVSYTLPSGDVIKGSCKSDAQKKNPTKYDSSQVLYVNRKVESIAEANELAEAILRNHNRFEKTASFKLPGNTALVCGCNVQLSGFGAWDGKYAIYSARHTVSNGYTTSIDCRKIEA